MIVGTQLAWVLRPYFDYFPWFIRPLEGNFYTAILQLISQFIGEVGAYLVALAFIISIVLLFFFALKPIRKEREEASKEAIRQEEADNTLEKGEPGRLK
jgi:hypothetical protein